MCFYFPPKQQLLQNKWCHQYLGTLWRGPLVDKYWTNNKQWSHLLSACKLKYTRDTFVMYKIVSTLEIHLLCMELLITLKNNGHMRMNVSTLPAVLLISQLFPFHVLYFCSRSPLLVLTPVQRWHSCRLWRATQRNLEKQSSQPYTSHPVKSSICSTSYCYSVMDRHETFIYTCSTTYCCFEMDNFKILL